MKKLKNIKVSLGITLLLALLVVGVAFAATVQLDNFDEGGDQDLSANSSNPTASSSINTIGTLGNERDMVLAYTSGAGSVYLDVNKDGSNLLTYSAAADTLGAATVVWDGDDDNPTVNNQGLGADLTGGGVNDGFHIKITENNYQADLTLKVYNSAADWCSFRMTMPGGILVTQHVDIFMAFGRFEDPSNPRRTCAGLAVVDGIDWANVSSIELLVNATLNAGTLLSLEFVHADYARDFGDLPDSYEISSDNQASNFLNGLRLGNHVDLEASKTPRSDAGGDDTNGVDDEDGVVRSPGVSWGPLGGKVDVVVNGCKSQVCYLSGWIDWNKDGNFNKDGNDTNEVAFGGGNHFPVTNGLNSGLNVIVPNGGPAIPGTYYARFRICDAEFGCSDPTKPDVLSGEIEDYYWGFSPTSVQLVSLEARPGVQGSVIVWVAGLALGLMIALGAFAAFRRRAS